MEQHPFIFSDQPKYRLKRHLYFWLFWFLFMSFLYAFLPALSSLSYWERIPGTMVDSMLYLPCHMFFSYSLMYFVIPRYIVKARYGVAAFWVVFSMLITGALAALISMFLVIPVKELLLPKQMICYPPQSGQPSSIVFCLALFAGLRGSIMLGGIAASIKLMKHFYVKEQTNLRLQKENAESQLQLLKAQVHPHFLFNTLNNIYSNTQTKAPEAAGMICGLSDILRYMLYECNKPLVPLAKELKMMEEYIELERVRYGNKLELHIDVPDNVKGLYIAPLMLLPFIENCFKHGLSNMLENPWMNLSIAIQKRELTMKLLNSKPSDQPTNHKRGIGIENVQKRLALLYPDRHQLTITEEEEIFMVVLKMELEEESVQTISVKPRSLVVS